MRALSEGVPGAGAASEADFAIDIAMPSAALSGLVTAIYEIRIGAAPIADELHPEWFNLRLRLSGEWWGQVADGSAARIEGPLVQGPTTGLTGFGGRDGVMHGIGLMPAGWAQLFGGTAEGLANNGEPLDRFVPVEELDALDDRLQAAADFSERASICEEAMLARLATRDTTARIERIKAVQTAISDPAIGTVEALADVACLGTRTLERLCRSAMGFAPKLLLRRQRFMRMLGQMHLQSPADWPDFLDPLYTDQSHMIRDFRTFLGTTPTGYFARERPILQASVAKRMAMLGAPMQALPRTNKTSSMRQY